MARKIEKRILVPARVREIPSSGFSWIDRRFIGEGFVRPLYPVDTLLYFFLIAVADRNGLSYWGDGHIAALLGVPMGDVWTARRSLVSHDLIAYEKPLYQVLELQKPERQGHGTSLGEILRGMAQEGE